jgi:signal peptidase II
MDDPRPPATFPASRWLVFWGIALGGLAFDLATKGWIFSSVGLPGSPPVSLVGEILELRTSYNQGALWGIGNSWEYSPWLFAGLSVVAASAIVYWLFFRGGAADRWLTIALALIMAGALGNCYDRIAFAASATSRTSTSTTSASTSRSSTSPTTCSSSARRCSS